MAPGITCQATNWWNNVGCSLCVSATDMAYPLSCFPICALVQWADVRGLYGLWVLMVDIGGSNWSSAVHSSQPEGPAPEEEALHLPAARLAGAERHCQGAQWRGGQVSFQGIEIAKIIIFILWLISRLPECQTFNYQHKVWSTLQKK